MEPITSRHNPIVARYRAAARAEAADIVLLDGVHLAAEAMASGVALREAAVSVGAADRPDVHEIVQRLMAARVPVTPVTSSVMDALSPLRSASGIVALAERPSTDAGAVFEGAACLVIVAVDVQDPGNLGAIVRVAEAAGASGLIAAGACADPFGWKALRGSMGSALRLPIAVQPDAAAAIEAARRHGCRVAAAVPRQGRSMLELDYTGAIAVLVGGEGSGLPPSIVAAADERLTIPMQPPVESLNAAVTAALILYEARRQRVVRGVQL